MGDSKVAGKPNHVSENTLLFSNAIVLFSINLIYFG